MVSGVGLVIAFLGLAAMWRTNRRLDRGWRSPLLVLTRRQRKELLAQVRGLTPIEPTRVPLARNLAARLVGQTSGVLILNLGILLNFVGQGIALPHWWRGALAMIFTLALAVGWLLMRRDTHRARRFLREHPAAAG